MTLATLVAEPDIVLRDGWNILVEKLGVQKATQFIVLLERGKGNTIEDIIKYWGNMNIEEIHHRVVAWKKQQKTA